MSKEEKKYPRAVVGVFIFNDKGQLLLTKSKKWHEKYISPGGRIEIGETSIAAAKREVKEETDLDIDELELIRVLDCVDIKEGEYTGDNKYLVSQQFKAKLTDSKEVKLNEELSDYKWLNPEEWLKRNDLVRFTKETIEGYLINTEDYKNKYARALADYQNLLKQTAKEKAEFGQFAREQFLIEILPVYDNLKMSLLHFQEEADQNNWIKGVEYVTKQFKDALNGMGVEEIKTVGNDFDHHAMEAMDNEETGDKKRNGKVAKEIKAGYKLNGKVVIPAKVIVYKFKN